MSDPALEASPAESSAARVIELSRSWCDQLQLIGDDELAMAQGLIAEALGGDATEDLYRSAGDALKALSRETERVAAGSERLVRQFEALRSGWRRARRYSTEGIDDLRSQLLRRAEQRPARAAKRWLNEVLSAIAQRETSGVALVARIELPLPDELLAGAGEIRSAAEAAAGGDRNAFLGLLVSVADATLTGWEEQLDAELRSTAHRLAAWLNVAVRGDIESARQHVDAAITLQPYDSRAYIERSALHRIAGESDLASRDAQRVIELEPESSLGFVALGACAEGAGDFDQADHLYSQALDRLPTWEATTLRGDALIDAPSGRLLVRGAERMLGVHRAQAALGLIDLALSGEVRGPGHYPEAEAYRVRADALEALEPVAHEEVAAAALVAGGRYLWDGQTDAAIEQLRRAKRHSSGWDDAGWLLADALVSTQNADSPDPVIAKEALDTWTEWRERYGPPEGPMAWAYVTRALISEDLPRSEEVDPDEQWWDALSYVERALVEDDADALRWALRARYTRNLGFVRLAGEALDRADTRDGDPLEVQAERLALLATLDRLEDAERAAEAMGERVGSNETLTVVRAYFAHRQKRDRDAIALLEDTLTEDSKADYHALLAVCHLAEDELDEARCSYGAVLARPSGASPAVLRLATLAVEATTPGSAPLGTDRRDDNGDSLPIDALIAYGQREPERASDLLFRAIQEVPTIVDLHDLECDFPLQLKLLPDEEARKAAEEAARAVLERAVAERRAELTEAHLTADEELARARDRADAVRADGGVTVAPEVARVVQAHRQQDRGELDAAALVYEELLSTAFDRMARIALGRVLMRRSDELAAARDIDRLEEVQARLLSLGATRAIDRTLAIAPVLVALGRTKEAQDRLDQALDAAAETSEDRERLLQGVGEASIAAGDLTAARRALREAVEIAEREHRDARAAQQYVRLGLVDLLSGRASAARVDVNRALAAWQRADAFVPEWLLVQEVQQLTRGVLPATVRMLLKPLLSAAGVSQQALLEAGPAVEPDDDSLPWP